ncbi:fumarylacetoacetate hydrolase family protein [Halobacterium sp. KA-4]|uniref:fumarylacetoacetate hydrolase family protein n=1 Tax=Halobacterium sp. KA-4 TaxID=2896367 RepID=UPI001E43D0BA|nr:fumarylacetoacetate hydrolase family protein [Halobacterium sp. KA-4]MCD2199384.1 fumarylacetoacetate hydrolase family protein [Halobacterium sp. KA-4]
MHWMRFRDRAGAVRRGEYEDGTVSFGGRTYDVDDVEVLPPAEPSKVVCVGRNYAAHAEERGEEVPDRPLLFLKPPNAVASDGDTVTLPGDNYIEHEAEVAVVIGEQCRNVAVEDALDVVAGYTAADDVSNRTDQSQEKNWVRGKAFDGACPLGPVLASPDEVPHDASVELRVNGETRQSSSIEHFIFTVPELIAEITEYMTLEPGDVIITGTPEGVAELEDGDSVEVEVEGVGTLSHDVERR